MMRIVGVAWAGLRLPLQNREVQSTCSIPLSTVLSRIGTTRKELWHHIFSMRLSAGPRCQASWSAWTKRSADIRFKEASGIHDTSRSCMPMSRWQAARPCSKVFFFVVSSGHDSCYRALLPSRLCEAPAGLSLFSQLVWTVGLHEHSEVNATMIGSYFLCFRKLAPP